MYVKEECFGIRRTENVIRNGSLNKLDLLRDHRRATMVGVEIDLVVRDSLAALELYEKIFDVES